MTKKADRWWEATAPNPKLPCIHESGHPKDFGCQWVSEHCGVKKCIECPLPKCLEEEVKNEMF